jgi:hypothetical protein
MFPLLTKVQEIHILMQKFVYTMKTTARPTTIYIFLTCRLLKKMSPDNPFKRRKLSGAGVDPIRILASTRTSENIKLQNKILNLIQYYGKYSIQHIDIVGI